MVASAREFGAIHGWQALFRRGLIQSRLGQRQFSSCRPETQRQRAHVDRECDVVRGGRARGHTAERGRGC